MRTPAARRATPSARPVALLIAVLAVLAVASPATAQDRPAGPVGGLLLGARGVVAPAGAPALPAGLTSASWLVADLDSGAVLAARDAHGRLAPASTLKTLTALALLPRLDPDQQVKPTFEDVNVEGSKVGIVQTLTYPVRDLVTAMMVVSGNDAANALATAAGGQAETARLMNAEAARLQALDTLAVNPSGLDAPGQLSSAYDLALLGRAALRSPDLREVVSTRNSSIAAPGGKRIEIYTHNKLIRNYEGALGVKNGYTSKAKASFIGAATRGGRTLVVTAMRGQPRIWTEVAALLDWGFAASAAGVVPVGQLVEPLPDPTVIVPPTDTARVTPAAVRTATEGGGPSAVLLGGGVVVSALAAARLRARRRRRGRLRLPA